MAHFPRQLRRSLNMATAPKKAAAKPAAKPAAKAAAKPAAAKKPVAKAAAAKPAAAKKPAAAPRKPNAAFMKPMTLSPVLAAVIGAAPIPRTEVTKKIWEYIKKHKLQDEANKRNINADDKLKAVFGGKAQVTMFEMTKLISAHLS
jgi:upstream activation factor subunit UAF30